jgi:hypothetical protein
VDDSQLEPFQPEQASPPLTEVEPASMTPRKRQNKQILIAGVLVAGLFLCVMLCVVVGGIGMIKASLERDDVERVVDEFMHAMAKGDTDAAYALFSTRAKRTVSRSKLDKLLQGTNFALFDGYTSAQIAKINLSRAFQTNPDLPQGTVAEVNGTITYEGGYIGRFEAVLEQEHKEWRLFVINVTIPPDKRGD